MGVHVTQLRSISTALLLSALTGILPAAAQPEFPCGELVEDVACRNDATQTYTLYLPVAYSEERVWPVLLVFDPRGRSVLAAEVFREAAERYGWVLLSSDNTRSDKPSWDLNFKAVSAMLPELSRFACDPQRTYAAGFSGGAMLAWFLGQQTQGLAGVIGSGGRPLGKRHRDTGVPFAYFGAAGDGEFNYEPTRELDALARKHGAPHRFETFPGPHRWMPPELALEAVEWMELQAMRAGTRPPDAELIASLYARDLARAEALEGAGQVLAAQRRFEAIARTFDGLRAVEKVQLRAAKLNESAAVKDALARERKARRYHDLRLAGIGRTLAQFRSPRGEIAASHLATDLRLETLKATATEDSEKGLAARRVLNSLNAQLSFYLPREFFAIKDYARAAAVLEVATGLGDDPGPVVWYNLASAQAQVGKRKQAVKALIRAIDAGYDDVQHMEQDSDLQPLRKIPEYQELVNRLRAKAP